MKAWRYKAAYNGMEDCKAGEDPKRGQPAVYYEEYEKQMLTTKVELSDNAFVILMKESVRLNGI